MNCLITYYDHVLEENLTFFMDTLTTGLTRYRMMVAEPSFSNVKLWRPMLEQQEKLDEEEFDFVLSPSS